MTIGRLNYVGVATPSIAASIETYRTLLGATAIGEPFDLPAHPIIVTPAKAGVQLSVRACGAVDPGLRRDDGMGNMA